MNLRTLFLLILLCLIHTVRSQEKKGKEQAKKEKSSSGVIKIGNNGEGMILDSLPAKEIREEISDSLSEQIERYVSPTKATFLSAVLPGLGQAYNRAYWKIPIVYAVLATSIAVFKYQDDRYQGIRSAYARRLAGFTDDPYYDVNNSGIIPGKPDINNKTLLSAQNSVKRDRDVALIFCVISYVLNIIDASVDAHMKYYQMDYQLTFKPFVKSQNTYNLVSNQIGVALNLNF